MMYNGGHKDGNHNFDHGMNLEMSANDDNADDDYFVS